MTGQIQPGGLLMPGAPRRPHHPFAKLFPMLTDEERVTFRASLSEGQNHPIILFEGMILDGRNRERDLVELNKAVSYVQFVGTRSEAIKFVLAENLERRHLDKGQRAGIAYKASQFKVGDNQYTRTREAAQICAPSLDLDQQGEAAPATETPAAMLSQTESAAIAGVSRRSVQHYATVAEKGAPELSEAVDAGKLAVSTAAEIASLPLDEQRKIIAAADPKVVSEVTKKINKDKNDKRRTERVEKIKAIAAGGNPLATDRKFPVVYMDPPTKFAAGDSDRSTENHYPTMTEEELAKLPIGDLATKDAVLFVWTTVPWLRKTIRLFESEGWGKFDYVSEIAWDKLVAGMGFWNRNRHECLLIATRGDMPAPDPSSLVESLYAERRRAHSAKPEYFRDVITRYYPDLPKVELFPRIDGALPETWFGWGNQANVPKQQALGLESAEAE